MEDIQEISILSRVSAQFGIASLRKGSVYAESTVVFANETPAFWAVLQSRVHELWAAFFASSLEDRLRYGPSDCFETYAFPTSDGGLGAAGAAYREHRAALMERRGEGLTQIYNRFHDPDEQAPDILRLRDLHHAMDQAVLRAYGWDDLAETAAPEFLTADTEPEHRYQKRLFWPAPFRDEVLARLLALNAERAANERARGLTPGPVTGELEDA